MSDLDLAQLAGAGAGGAGVVALGKWLLERFVGRSDEAEKKAEARQEHKLDQVLVSVQNLERDLAIYREKQTAHEAVVAETRARIDGVSANHGPRVSALEERVTRLEERNPRGRK